MLRLPVVLTSVLALGLSAVLVSSPEAVAAGQTAKFYMLPQLAQPGSAPASAGRASSAMWAKLRPARPGRKVVLQRKSGARWVNLTTRREDRQGVVQFTAPYQVKGKIARYRVSAVRYKGLRKLNSASAATNTWGSPAFDEQFTGAWRSEWSDRIQGYNYQRHCARTDAQASVVGATTAALSVFVDSNPPTTTPCSVNSSYAYRLNGMIGTQRTQDNPGFAFRYGFAAARIKFQPGAGQHAGFWLQTEPRLAEATAQRYEIDAIEWYGNRRNDDREMSSQIHVCDATNCQGSMVHYPSAGQAYISNPSRFGSDWSSKYHVFSVQWTSSGYVFRIDGKPIRSITSGVSHQYEYLVLSLLSSDWELASNPDANPKQTMDVDWVRVWSSDYTARPTP